MFTRTHKVPTINGDRVQVGKYAQESTNKHFHADQHVQVTLFVERLCFPFNRQRIQSHLKKCRIRKLYRVFKIFTEERWKIRMKSDYYYFFKNPIHRISLIQGIKLPPSHFHALSQYLNPFANASNHACSSISPIYRSHFQQQVSQFYYYYRYPTG